ncbi:MAG: inositol phosphorylceramide synthase [Sphingobacteriales bacterium]|nr:MAG: inositol phosphorylceramide synthase [Sphingobacteriales bacterium]
MLTKSGEVEEVNRKIETISSRKRPSLFAKLNLLFALLASLGYLLLSYFLIGFNTDQLVLVFLFNTLYFLSFNTRRFILAFSIFIIYWIIFDYMKAFPNYRYNPVHIQDLYNLEKSWFGIEWNNSIVTPNEFFAQNNSIIQDILTGIFYLCWIPVPLAFAAIMFFKNRNLFFQFSLTFFLVNILGWIGYYSYPAAPPWYVAQHGFGFVANTPGNIGGLVRFDELVGIGIFQSIYAKSSNVFAAMPSLHSAYIMIVVFYAAKAKMKGWVFLFAVITMGIWFGAVYSSHHYVLDVLAGILCAVVGISLFQWWTKTESGKNRLAKMVAAITK